MKILFLLPASGWGGGANAVVQEAHAMRAMGIDARVATPLIHRSGYEATHSHIGALDALMSYYADEESLDRCALAFDVVIATVYHSVRALERVSARSPAALPAYYVQDHEPRFFEKGSAEWREARESYRRIPGTVLFAYSKWVRDAVKQEHGADVLEVPPSLDVEMFRPSLDATSGGGAIHVAAMIRPSTPRRGPARTMRVLRRLADTFGDEIEVHLFGCRDAEIADQGLDHAFPFTNHGQLTRQQVARLLRGSQLFLDLSDFQAFGRTALEAMASGCAVVVPREGGAREFAAHGENAIVADTASEDACYLAAARLIVDRTLRRRLAARGIDDALRYPVEPAAAGQLAILGRALAERRRAVNGHPPRIMRLSVFTPMQRGTTPASSHVRLLQPLSHPPVAREIAAAHPSLDRVLSGQVASDAVLVQRTAIPPDRATGLVGHVRRTGRPLIVELDDDLFLLEGADEYKDRLDGIRALLEVATLVTVATPHLAEAIAEHTAATVAVVPNSLDERLWFEALEHLPGGPAAAAEGSQARAKGKLRILYMGTWTHAADLDLLRPALEELRTAGATDVELEVIGGEPAGQGQQWYRRRNVPWGHSPYPHFVKWLRSDPGRWSLAVAPLEDTEFNRSKSDLKLLEYAALDLPAVVSDVEPYRAGEGAIDALRVPNEPAAWAEAISALLDDADRRATLARAAKARVRETRCLDTAPSAFADEVSSVL